MEETEKKYSISLSTYDIIKDIVKKKRVFSKRTIENETDGRFNYSQITEIISYMLDKKEILEYEVDKRSIYEWIGDKKGWVEDVEEGKSQ